MRWVKHTEHKGEMKSVYKILVRRPEMKRPCGRPRHRWDYNTRMAVREIGWEFVDWMYLSQK
jgi:hypothetical protein